MLRHFYAVCLKCVFSLAVFLSVAVPALAQTDSASINGVVQDTQDARISNATVKLVNTLTGTENRSATNANGLFTIPGVPPGKYTLQIVRDGFADTQVKDITLNVGDNKNLSIRMKIGSQNESVTVDGSDISINTNGSSVSTVITGRQITELPLNGRNFANLAYLSPGVAPGYYEDNSDGVSGNTETFRNGESGGASLSVNGLRPQVNNFILDGIDNNESLVNTIVFFPPVEATQEFRITTAVAQAEFGRAGGAIVQSSIKSGTNSIHGSAFEFYRSSKFDSNPNYRFLGASELPTPPFNRNQFGGTVGFPIIKDKLFLFGDYQGLREITPLNTAFVTVPTALMRKGDFSELLNPALTGGKYVTTIPGCALPSTGVIPQSQGQIYDPITCAPISYQGHPNVIDPARLNQAALNYLNAFPLPSIPNAVQDNYAAQSEQTQQYNDFDVRLDYAATQKDKFFARFSYAQDSLVQPSIFTNLPSGARYGAGSNYAHDRGIALGYTRTLDNSMLNELRVGYVRDSFGNSPAMSGIPVSQNLGIVNANRTPQLGGGAQISGDSSQLQNTGDGGPYFVPENSYEITDSFTWSHDRHTFKFGGTAIRREVAFFRPVSGKGTFSLGEGDFTGYDVSELLAGFTDSYEIGSQDGFYGTRSYEDGFFAQDDWRITDRLTLNLGLRYDLLTWPVEEHNRQAALDITTGHVLLAGQNGVSRGILNNNYGNFAPRIGFAYDLFGTGKTSLRGGYGMYYFVNRAGIADELGEEPPFGGSVDYLATNGYRVTFTGQAPLGNGLTGSFDNRLATQALPLPGFPNFNPNSPPQGLSMLAVTPNSKNSVIQQWNLQIEQQLTPKTTFTIAYVGTKSDHLSTYYDYNFHQYGTGIQNFPNLGSVTWQSYSGVGHYAGLQTKFEHRYSNGLSVIGAYTWSHTLDNSPGPFEGTTVALYYDPKFNYANSVMDQRQIFTSGILYELPFGRGQHWGTNISRPLDWAVGGWQVNILSSLVSGTPLDLETNGTPENRPDQIAPLSYPKSISGTWFSTASYSNDIPRVNINGLSVYSRVGNAPPNQIYEPGIRTVALSLMKTFHLTDRYNLELHGDGFNIFNTPQFVLYGNQNIDDANFGKITSTQRYSNRQIQLAARITF